MTEARFFHPQAGEKEVRIDREDPAHHYFLHVVRARAGEKLVLYGGGGVDYVYRLREADSRGLDLALVEKVEVGADPKLSLTLLLAVLKGDHVSDVVRQVVPLGVGQIIPFIAGRGVRRPKENCIARWTAVAEDAVRQCGRTRPVGVQPVCDSIGAAVGTMRSVVRGAVAGLIFWEESDLSLEEGLARVEEKVSGGGKVAYVIGPEGGFEEEEVRVAAGAGLVPCRMGVRILRSELAAVVGASLIQHRVGDLR